MKAVTYIARVRGGGGGRGKGRGGEVIDLGGITLPLPRVHLAHGPGEARHDIAAAPGPPSQVCHRRLRPHKPCLLDRPSAQRRVQNLTKTLPPMAIIRCFRKMCFIVRFRTKGHKGPNSHGGGGVWATFSIRCLPARSVKSHLKTRRSTVGFPDGQSHRGPALSGDTPALTQVIASLSRGNDLRWGGNISKD